MYKHYFLNSLHVIYVTYHFLLVIVSITNSNSLADQSINSHRFSGGNPREFKLTKLLNIEIGEPEKLMDIDIRNSILSEVERGIKSELSSSTQQLGPGNTSLGNYSQKELVTILKELYSEVTELKKSMPHIDNNFTSECLIQSDILDGKSYPVGVSFHRLCSSSVLNKDIIQSTKEYVPRSCKEILEQGHNVSGVYRIQPKRSEKPFMVLCDMETKGGGWTHIQKRFDGSVDFFLGWREYKFGFGDLESEFWIGLENIYRMTGFEISELLVEIVDRENNKAYAHYKGFAIGSEPEGYSLNTLKGFSGDAGDSLIQHLGNKFSTKDFDQDDNSGNCAVAYSGAWWYKSCHASNLNGKYINAVLPEHYKYQGMHWLTFKSHEYCHAKSRMMVRPV